MNAILIQRTVLIKTLIISYIKLMNMYKNTYVSRTENIYEKIIYLQSSYA